ncbi:MAG: S41 family peptidase [Elusimicrobia bacterium]|nr:S41 family peptidase [Elusimicrobiota bacterium]MBI4217507.1 S41 family peptidase [Elusimicrobiota bacterium]
MKKNHGKKILLISSFFLGFLGTFAFQKLSSAQAETANVDKTLENLQILVEVFDYIQQNYVTEKDTKNLIYGAAHGMVRTLDPFSQFLEPEPHKEMQTETEGQFGGLGIRIEIRNDWLTVMTPIPDTPAYRAGLLPGDKIVKIEGEWTQGISLQDAVRKLRGQPGTQVKISIVHDGSKEPQDITLTREVIKIESTRSRMLEDKIGYVQLLEFTAKTDADMNRTLTRLSNDGMDALVLDLRNNPGGLLNSAVNVSKTFLDNQKLIVYTEGRKTNRVEYKSDVKAPFAKIPMVILVNGGSASGSEIVAGAMQDHHRALIVGTTTFGKASVQSVIPLSDGSGLRLTTAKYYTPAGRAIQRDEKTGKGGIVPDILIEVTRETEIKLRRQQEEIYAKDRTPQSVIKKEEQVDDLALKRAVEFLKARRILNFTP